MIWRKIGIASLFLLLLTITSFVSGWLVVSGAAAAGMRVGGQWNLGPLVYFGLGGIGGGVMFCVLCAVFGGTLRYSVSKSMMLSVVTVVILAFPGGCAGYKFSQYQEGIARERSREQTRKEVARYEEYLRQLKENPGIVLTEKWYEDTSGPDWLLRCRVYRESLENPEVPYTADVLCRLLSVERNSVFRRRILQHPRFDPLRLEYEFEMALEGAQRGSEAAGERLVTLLSGPPVKNEWFEKVAESEVPWVGTDSWKISLRTMINKRRRGK